MAKKKIGWVGKAISLLGIVALGLYIANIGFGVVELLPDNLPLVGNLDEASAGALIVYLIKNLKS